MFYYFKPRGKQSWLKEFYLSLLEGKINKRYPSPKAKDVELIPPINGGGEQCLQADTELA